MDSPMQRWEFRFEAGKSVSTCTIQNPILDISDLEDFMVQVANCAGFPWVKAVDLYEVDEQADTTDGASKPEEKARETEQERLLKIKRGKRTRTRLTQDDTQATLGKKVLLG